MSSDRVLLVWIVATGLGVGAAGAIPASKPESPAPDTSLSLERGMKVYERTCASCHGRDGRGDGPAARDLDPRPRDFTSGKFKFRSTPTGSAPTDDDLYRIVTEGIPRSYMFSWKGLLSERDRRDVVAYIKTFSDVFEDDRVPLEVPAEPPSSVATVADGKSIYMVMQCFSCHGPDGRGDGSRAGSLTDDWGREIEAFDFTRGAYKGGSDGRSVFKTFETGLNGTPMPSYADAFLFGSDSINPETFAADYPEDDIAALRRYLSSQATATELSAMSEQERQRLVAERKWALVHYVQSLSRDAGLFHWLLFEDTELVKQE